MRISNLNLAISELDTETGEIFIGDKVIKTNHDTILSLVRETLGPVEVVAAPPSRPATKRAAARTASEPARRGPGRPRKVEKVEKVTKKEKSGRVGNGSHMAGVWVKRRANVKKGFCAFCDKKHLPGSNFCKDHFQTKYPGKPLPTAN